MAFLPLDTLSITYIIINGGVVDNLRNYVGLSPFDIYIIAPTFIYGGRVRVLLQRGVSFKCMTTL